MGDANEYVLTFGKHKDRPLKAVLDSDPQYLVWLAGVCTPWTMKKSSRDALAKVIEEQGDTCVNMAKQMVQGKCYKCLAIQCNCLSRVGRQYRYHPYGKQD
jgi:hypothetical protein